MLLLVSAIALFSLVDGYSDPHYLRFTSPQQNSLILGNSKSAQGLRPSVMNQILKADLYNYSFDIGKSPYGPKYFESVRRKLSPNSKNGVFILTVDCWSVSTRFSRPNDVMNFEENNSAVGMIKSVNRNPNLDYLLNYFSGSYYSILAKSPQSFLHNDGWLEVSLDDDPESTRRRTESTLSTYEGYLDDFRYSSVRFSYLLRTIKFLKQHGQVYLVRMPVSEQLMIIEKKYDPHFDRRIKQIESKTDGFLDLTPENKKYDYTDGVHLEKKSGREVSEKIAHWIVQKNSTLKLDSFSTKNH